MATPNNTTVSDNDLKAEVERLRSENEKLKAAKHRPMSVKIGNKGGVVISGMGRFPTTLYADQVVRLAAFMPEVLKFVEENKDKLASKE